MVGWLSKRVGDAGKLVDSCLLQPVRIIHRDSLLAANFVNLAAAATLQKAAPSLVHPSRNLVRLWCRRPGGHRRIQTSHSNACAP